MQTETVDYVVATLLKYQEFYVVCSLFALCSKSHVMSVDNCIRQVSYCFQFFFRLPPQRNVVICLDRYNRQPMKAQCTYFEQKEKNYAEMLKSFYRLTDEIAYLITIVIKLVN